MGESSCLRQLRDVFPLSADATAAVTAFPPLPAPPMEVCRLNRLRSLEMRSNEAVRSTAAVADSAVVAAGTLPLFSYSSRVLKLKRGVYLRKHDMKQKI